MKRSKNDFAGGTCTWSIIDAGSETRNYDFSYRTLCSLSPFSYILTNINVILLNLKIILIFDPFWLNKYLFRSIEEFQDYSTAWRWECNNKWPNTESSLIKRMAIAA